MLDIPHQTVDDVIVACVTHGLFLVIPYRAAFRYKPTAAPGLIKSWSYLEGK
jgi:hypothetical protein